ncbi:MAG: ABC transporter substrate-binding protein [Promethearchaeota archaeon]
MIDRKEINNVLNIFLFVAILVNTIIFLLISSIIVYDYDGNGPWRPGVSIVLGTSSGPFDLDPADCWDKDSQMVIEQAVETLFTYDTRQYIIDETMPLTNWLATGYSWDITNTVLTVDIRIGVFFHDGTPMDAAAVAWNFNRFMYLMNHTGELPSDGRAVKVHSLYEFPDRTPVFQSVVAADVDTVVFTLTAPYAPILDAMCYISCGILSPSSTPATEIIDLTGDIVGTGPYTYDYYITDTEVVFRKFEGYWGAGVVEDEIMYDILVYSVIDDPEALNFSMLAGDIDFLFEVDDDLISTFRTNPWVTVYESDKPGLEYNYISFNVNQINLTWRKAMSYAINYSYITEEMLNKRAFRAYSAISWGNNAAFNSNLTESNKGSAYYNLTIARQVILDDLGGDVRIDPRLQANDSINDPLWSRMNLKSFNFTYIWDHLFAANLYFILEDWFTDIGVNMTPQPFAHIMSDSYIIKSYYSQIQIYCTKWSPDYVDPFSILNPLFSNISLDNSCQLNDKKIQLWLTDALYEINQTVRYSIYHKVQSRLYTQLYCHAPLYHNQIIYVHSADLYDVGYNIMGRWWALPIKRNYTWIPSI